jgi:hypothetical protein
MQNKKKGFRNVMPESGFCFKHRWTVCFFENGLKKNGNNKERKMLIGD